MHPSTETIVAELLLLDPTLKDHESELHALVTALLTLKPTVFIDQTFVHSLRRELLLHAETYKPLIDTVLSHISWWMVRLVPIGALAILTFAFFPTKYSTPVSLPLQERGGMETSSDALYKTSSAPARMTEVEVQSPLVFDAITITQGGFVVVKVGNEIVGVSRFLTPGTTVGVQVNLLRTVLSSETLIPQFYMDNGDGVFTNEDTPTQMSFPVPFPGY